MANRKLSLFYAALGAFALALAAVGGRDSGNEFGVVDPAYRSAYPDTAWFLRQRGDTRSPADDPELAPLPVRQIDPVVADAR